MTEDWRAIQEFPGYSVSDTGFVRNDETGRRMSRLVNQSGVVNVGLTRKGVQHKRSLSLLVANAFLPVPRYHTFDTVINLNGDRFDNVVTNIAWRPRWFAVQYFQQFQTAPNKPICPVREVETGERFGNSWDAATKYGLLDLELRIAATSNLVIWPTYQRFQLV